MIIYDVVNVIIEDCTFTNNKAEKGGVIAIESLYAN